MDCGNNVIERTSEKGGVLSTITNSVAVEADESVEIDDAVFASAESDLEADTSNQENTPSENNRIVEENQDLQPVKRTSDSEESEPAEAAIEVLEAIAVNAEDSGITEIINRESLDAQPIEEFAKASQESANKSKKGPLPGLLPLEQVPESQAPLSAALKSAEITEAMAKLETLKASIGKDVAELGMTDADATEITMQKLVEPSIDVCKSCNKMESCAFQAIGKQSKSEINFCSKSCVQDFFKYGNVCYLNSAEEEEKNETSGSMLRSCLEDHIVIEPDIEIHTLSDEFQMEFDETESCIPNGQPQVISPPFLELIDSAARQTMCCASCRVSLYNSTDALTWEAMEFCSDKCLTSYIRVIGSHCNMCNSQVGEQHLGKLCVRFGTVIRQFCSADCLEKFKGSHKLCAQCQVNMSDKEKVYCSETCEDLARRLLNKSVYYGQKRCSVCNELRAITDEIFIDGQSHFLCSKPCRNAYRFAEKVTTLCCGICSRHFDLKVAQRYASRNDAEKSGQLTWYCSNTCFATYLLKKRKIEHCTRCQVKKYNVDMIRKPTISKLSQPEVLFFCSLYCYTHRMIPVPPREPVRKKMVEMPSSTAQPPTVNNTATQSMPAIGTILTPAPKPAPPQGQIAISAPLSAALKSNSATLPIELQHKIIFVPPQQKEMKNKAVWCRPCDQSQQTEATYKTTKDERRPLYIPIPIPVPIYVPVPMAMYCIPVPFPVGFPVPLITPLVLPVSPDVVDEVMAAIEESRKEALARDDSMIDCGANLEECRTENLELDTLSDDIVVSELEIPYSIIQMSKFSSRKRSNSTPHQLPLPKRFKEADVTKCSSDGEESSNAYIAMPSSVTFDGTFQKELGVKAWTHWNNQKKSTKLSAMNFPELNSNLIAFAKEIRKPDGEPYRPDVLLYFIYGLQVNFVADQRRENLLMDAALLPFQLELDKHLMPFYESLVNAVNSDGTLAMPTSLKESHLWECRQLGVDSPIVLVFTMLYFNTKYFRLYTVEQHEQLAFINVNRELKKSSPGSNSTCNGTAALNAKIYSLQLLVRPKHEGSNGTTLKRKQPLEMPQNIDKPAQCPIKHYNFYCSKCPDNTRMRRDVFYLLPEPASNPESPVWYSSQPVPREILARMLRRVLLIEEVLRNLCASE